MRTRPLLVHRDHLDLSLSVDEPLELVKARRPARLRRALDALGLRGPVAGIVEFPILSLDNPDVIGKRS